MHKTCMGFSSKTPVKKIWMLQNIANIQNSTFPAEILIIMELSSHACTVYKFTQPFLTYALHRETEYTLALRQFLGPPLLDRNKDPLFF